MDPTIRFDPHNLTVTASLNRVRIIDLPGVELEEKDILGKRGFELLSTDALIKSIMASAGKLLMLNRAPVDMPLSLDRCFESSDTVQRDAAEAIARRYGHCLGYLIATLKRGDRLNREARPEWNDTFWQHWAGIRQVWLGGGIVSGRLGPRAVEYAREAVANARVEDCALDLPEYPALLPVMGAARCAPTGTAMMAVFDFGGTFTKRAYAFYGGKTVASLQVLPKKDTDIGKRTPDRDPDEMAHELANFMVRTMAKTWHDAYQSGLGPSHTIVATVASYITNGRLDPLQIGIYGELRRVATNIAQWLSQAVGDQLGQSITVELLHDGTAAAMTFAGKDAQQTAAITLGTALGVGFPPPGKGLLPMSRSFTVS